MSREIADHLRYYADMGVTGISRDATWRDRAVPDTVSDTRVAGVHDALSGAVVSDTLDTIKADIGPACTRCKLCTLGRSQIVFGVGHPKARLMFVGEAPGEEEDKRGEPFLFRQIDVIQPAVIVPLGKFAAQCLLKTADPITRLRGRRFDYRGTTLIPTFHPAYLLRNPSAKREVWEDMKLVRAILQGDA